MCSYTSDEAEKLCLHSSLDTCGDGSIDVEERQIRAGKWRISGFFRVWAIFRGSSVLLYENLMSTTVYYNLTTYRPDAIDVAIKRKAKISAMPD